MSHYSPLGIMRHSLINIAIFEIGWYTYNGILREPSFYRKHFTHHTEKEAIEAMKKITYAHNVARYGTVYK